MIFRRFILFITLCLGLDLIFLITLFLLVMCFAVASIVAWRWSKHGLKETTMAAGDGAKTAEDRQL